jgi:hypothetical protein
MMGRVTVTSHNLLILLSPCTAIRPARFGDGFGTIAKAFARRCESLLMPVLSEGARESFSGGP